MPHATLPRVSVLFVTYRRPDMLRRTLEAFLAQTDYPRELLELVVADDGSPSETQRLIERMGFDRLVLAKANRGLGANNNAGIRACTADYVLMLQDDWQCNGPPDYLQRAAALLTSHADLEMVRFYGDALPADLPAIGSTGARLLSRSLFPNLYSDTPHLRTRRSIERVGPYREDLWMEKCELDYQQRFVAQCREGVAVFPDFYNRTFVHEGFDQSLRLGDAQTRLRNRLSPWAGRLKKHAAPLYGPLRSLYERLEDASRRVRLALHR